MSDFIFAAYDAEENIIDYREIQGGYLDAWKECAEQVVGLKQPIILTSGFSHATLEDIEEGEVVKTWRNPETEMSQAPAIRQLAEAFKRSGKTKGLDGEDMIDALVDYIIDASRMG